MSEALFRGILEGLEVGIVAVDGTGEPRLINAAARALLGDRIEELVVLARSPGGQLAYMVGADGAQVRVVARALDRADGRAVGAVAIIQPSSASVAELRKAETFLGSIVENIPDMIFVKDAEQLRFELFNRAGEVLLGKSRRDLIGKNDYDFFPTEQADFFQTKDRETLARGALVDIPQEPIETPHGVRWLHTKKIPIVDEHGTPKYLLGISEDVTERKEAREALDRAHRELEQRVSERTAELSRANAELRRSEAHLRQAQKMEAIGRLAGGIAHDFNNLLTVIVTEASRMRSRTGDAERVQVAAQAIADAAERAAELTRQLVAFSRRQVVQAQDLDLGGVVRRMEPMLSRLLGEQVTLRLDVQPGGAPIHADPGQIEQVVLNLAVNARDAMAEGGRLDIRVSRVELPEAIEGPSLPPGHYVLLAVQDSGTGMDEETVSHIFEPFFTTKDYGKGSGLGLATVYGIVTQSRGAVRVDTAPGRGSRFDVFFPEASAAATACAADQPPVVADRGHGHETLLLVEDDAAVRRSVTLTLTEAGYRVIEARNGVEGLAIIETHAGAIDAVISDLVMPEMSGREMVRRARLVRPSLRVLFLSGYAPPTGTEAAVELDGPLLAKPFDPEALVHRIRDLLDSAG